MPKHSRPTWYWNPGLRTWVPAHDDTQDKKRRLDAAADLALAADQPELAGFIEGVSNLPGDQIVPSDLFTSQAAPSSQATGSRSGRSRARMPKFSRRRKWNRRRRRRTFNSKVGSALLKFTETKRQIDSVTQANFSAGDGTTRVLYIAAPISQLTQGTSGDDIVGDNFWIKAMWLRGRISLDQTTNSLRVRICLLRTHQYADLGVGFTTYGNTTTGTTNPTQDVLKQESNIRMFETSAAEEAGQPSAPYVGNSSGIDIFDNDYVTVIGGREYFLSQQHLLNFQNVDIFIPINKKHRGQSDFDAAPADQLRTYRDFNYYWVVQVFSNSNANNILVAQDILGTFDIVTYVKEI